jgi:hypothetical protein
MTGLYKAQLQIANECCVNLREVTSVIRKLKIVGFKRIGSAKTVYTPKQQSLIQAKLQIDGKSDFLILESKMNYEKS